MIDEMDLSYLKRCVALARATLEKGDQPFGSVLVSEDGEVLFEDHNHIASGDYTQHPEFNIARWAGQNLTAAERRAATVYTSGEHCPMCSAAHGKAGLGRIVYASSSKQFDAWKAEMGVAEHSAVRPLAIEEVLVDPEVAGPVPELADEIRSLHEAYYKKKRG